MCPKIKQTTICPGGGSGAATSQGSRYMWTLIGGEMHYISGELRSRTGILVKVNGAPIYWKSSMQKGGRHAVRSRAGSDCLGGTRGNCNQQRPWGDARRCRWHDCHHRVRSRRARGAIPEASHHSHRCIGSKKLLREHWRSKQDEVHRHPRGMDTSSERSPSNSGRKNRGNKQIEAIPQIPSQSCWIARNPTLIKMSSCAPTLVN